MTQVTCESLLSLEDYAQARSALRETFLAYKKRRTVHLGDHVTLLFEDERTVRYQVQEMLRIERIATREAVEDELRSYNPLIPDGQNWKATLLIAYAHVAERRQALARLKGIERRIWVSVRGFAPIYAIADEDLERENAHKTSAVHFLRFELTDAIKTALGEGAAISVGCDHPDYIFTVESVPGDVRESLCGDLV